MYLQNKINLKFIILILYFFFNICIVVKIIGCCFFELHIFM